jgi:branched-chain amino acid aminotransferase
MEVVAREMDVPVEERSIDRSELYAADELFFCGTGVQIAAIVSVDRRPIGSGQIGPFVSRLRKLYFDVVRGRVPHYRAWCTPVYAEATATAQGERLAAAP